MSQVNMFDKSNIYFLVNATSMYLFLCFYSGFIRTLPDKGEKCAAFAEYLRSVICQKSETSADRNTLMKDLTNSSFSKESGIPIDLMTDVKEKEHKMDLSESLQVGNFVFIKSLLVD